MTVRKTQSWDAPGILAEIKRRGETLTGLAKANGLSEAACRSSLARAFPAADKVIAEFLQVPLHELWPTRYQDDGTRIDRRTMHFRAQNTRERTDSHRQNTRAA